ncbi:MAG: hypothetical protein EAZ74_05850 [Alphaproteobacteria bacterium]|nr:MAG: hypothetical protein EAY76_07205 [Alphaproteobacteria bacterium]TAF13375.1 MAG: hypothetical protein EAZ74_05850 [Alphaproteobacteria bacterium]TAF39346.1 MAG: hypothetical protein EAZ66_04845 [Alphaproteobacteria bacterium]TAF75130.1 MAG: hypothetical protein EAZ52_07525 [Alphaproteobacteria bacterium]
MTQLTFSHDPQLEIDYKVLNPKLEALAREEMQDLLRADSIARINNVVNPTRDVSHAQGVQNQPINLFDAEHGVSVASIGNNAQLSALLQKEVPELFVSDAAAQSTVVSQGQDVSMNDVSSFLARVQQERNASKDKGFSIV